MTISRALDGVPFSVDQFRCRDAAERLKHFRAQSEVHPWSNASPVSQLVFKTLFISVCHQFNWDFLQSAMAAWLLPAPELRLAELKETQPTQIADLLREYPRPERIRSQERAKMLRATAAELEALLRSGTISSMLVHRRLNGQGGFYDTMKGVAAFREDELEKKVRVLAHDLYREGVIPFVDPQNLRPAVEYHLLRLYLRSGRVYPTDQSVKEELEGRSAVARPRLVHTLRKTVEEAMNLTAFYSGLDVATLNYAEWQIGRSVCTAENPRCDTPSAELPADVAALSPNRCLFSNFCRAYNEPQYGWFHEPHFQKAIY